MAEMKKSRLEIAATSLLGFSVLFLVWSVSRPVNREWVRLREHERWKTEGSVVNDLRQIQAAKYGWAGETYATGSVEVTERNIASWLPRQEEGLMSLKTSRRVIFKINRLDVPPEAVLTRASIEGPKGTLVRLTNDQPDYVIVLPTEGK